MTLLSLTVFGWDLASEPHFVDESAYVSQSFFADLLVTGKWNDPAWLTYAGYDIPPLPKYLIGLALRVEGYRRPGPAAMAAWYQDTTSRFVSTEALVAARRPSVLFGAIGCLSLYAIGTMALDRRLGFLAALLLMSNPLYFLHARRAMSDVPAESLMLAGLAVGLWAWKRVGSGSEMVYASLGLIFGSGILGGLATLSKLNGALGGMVLAGWGCLAMVLPTFRWWSKATFLGATVLSGCVSFATFAALNPFLFANPRGRIDPSLAPMARLGFLDSRLGFLDRIKLVADHRVNVSRHGQSSFPDDALRTPLEKVEAVAVQGFGRFGHFGVRGWTDSTIRFDWEQDWGTVVWLPWVVLGSSLALIRGRAQFLGGEPPAAWAVLVQVGLAMVVVTSFIPLAWDRYFLSIQPGCALLGAFAVVEGFDRVRPLFGRESQS